MSLLVLAILAYLGGLLTIVSPCVLPVVPLVFAGGRDSIRGSVLPRLAGLATTFVVVAAAVATGGEWAVRANQIGRAISLALLALFAVTLLVPDLARRVGAPLARLGATLQGRAEAIGGAPGEVVLGVALGFLWAPCAGPILGLVLTTAALGGTSLTTLALLAAFAGGAASALAAAAIAGGRIARLVLRSRSAEVNMRRVLSVLAIATVVVIAGGWDTELLARVRALDTTRAEQALIHRLSATRGNAGALGESLDQFAAEQRARLPALGPMPELSGGTTWLNSPPLDRAALSGKVVLVDFWTFGCYNCRNALPYVKEYYRKYKDQGLVVIGVHTPEFPYEKDIGNVRRAVRDLGVEYPVVVDNDYRIWNAFHNEYWPAAYYVDARGEVRYHHFGEGRYEEQDAAIRSLLAEARRSTGE